MADEPKESADSLSDIFSVSATETSSAPEKESTEDISGSTESKDDKSSSEEGGAEKLPAEKSDESTKDSKPPVEDKSDAEKPDAEKAKDDAAEKPNKAAEEKAKSEAEAKAKADADPYQKRFEDTHKWANELNQQNSQLRQIAQKQEEQLAILQKKVDGTWTDEDEAKLTQGEDTETVATRAVIAGKAIASRSAANRDYGQDVVNTTLTEFHQLFRGNSAIQQVLRDSDSPVHAVMEIMDRYRFEKQYGASPAQWKENIAKETKASLEKDLRKSIFEEIRAGKKKATETPESLAETHGDRGSPSNKNEGVDSLESIFKF
jgi:hypothetical protein